jgi:hypothetical protein
LDAEIRDETDLVLHNLLLVKFVPPNLGALRRALFFCPPAPTGRKTVARLAKGAHKFAQFSEWVRNRLHNAPIFLEDALVSA